MKLVDLDYFIFLKIVIILLLIAFFSILITFCLFKKFNKKQITIKGNNTVTKCNFYIISLFFVIFLLLFLSFGIIVKIISNFVLNVKNDGAVINKELNSKDFYYGFQDLSIEFIKIKGLSQTQQFQVQKIESINTLIKSHNSHKIINKKSNYFKTIISIFFGNQKINNFIKNNWKIIDSILQKYLLNVQTILKDDIKLCDRAINEIDYFQKRYNGSFEKIASKINIIFWVILLTTLIFIFLTILGLKRFKLNISQNKNKNQKDFSYLFLFFLYLSLTILILGVGLLIISSSAKNGILETNSVIDYGFLNISKNKDIEIFPNKLVTEFITDFYDILLTLIQNNKIKFDHLKIKKMNLFFEMEALQNEKDDIINKVHKNIDGSSFGTLFKIQRSKLLNIVNIFDSFVSNGIFWLGIFGFIFHFVSLMFHF